MEIKNLIIFILVILCAVNLFSIEVDKKYNLIEKFEKGLINWTEGYVDIETEITVPDVNQYKNMPSATIVAEKNAKSQALYDITHFIQDIYVTTDLNIEYYKNMNPSLSKKIDKLVRNAKLIDKLLSNNETLKLVHRVKLLGDDGIMGINEIYNPEYSFIDFNSKSFFDYSASAEYFLAPVKFDYIIIDARNLEIKPIISPNIYDDDENLIYGAQNVDGRSAITNGIVKYLKIDCDNSIKKLFNSKTLTISALKLGKKPGDIVIKKGDAQELLSSEYTKMNLKRCNVIVITGTCK